MHAFLCIYANKCTYPFKIIDLHLSIPGVVSLYPIIYKNSAYVYADFCWGVLSKHSIRASWHLVGHLSEKKKDMNCWVVTQLDTGQPQMDSRRMAFTGSTIPVTYWKGHPQKTGLNGMNIRGESGPILGSHIRTSSFFGALG
jgi:hypothetical protein